MVYPDHGWLLGAKKKWDIKPSVDMENLKCILLSERTQSEEKTA